MSKKLKTTNIKGKEYVEVNERIIAFRSEKQYQGFALLSEVIAFDENHCIVKATVRDADGRDIATGLAHETKQGSRINQTSMLENCETSAWGRALGNLGIGVDTSIATYEEVSQAIAQQEASKQSQQPEKPAQPEKPKSNAGNRDLMNRIYRDLKIGSKEQKILVAKLLGSSAFEEDRDTFVQGLNKSKSPKEYSEAIDMIKEELAFRKNRPYSVEPSLPYPVDIDMI